MILLKGSLLLLVPQKTQCLQDQERIYGDDQHHFLSVQERIPWIARNREIFACKEFWFSDVPILRSMIGLENSRHPRARIFSWFSRLAYFHFLFWLAHFGSSKLDRNAPQWVSEYTITAKHTLHQCEARSGKLKFKIAKITTDKYWDEMFYLIALLQQWRPPERIIRTYPIAFPIEK